ncbi:putative transcriptional regulator, TetR family [Kribbella flavida DSM 17836]|uniref:Putative transcriptional regulator, TetR family n=1 Tax=Kribbella flavida (strain DSM 17836 / JCM 10339 / NBRC 14399) TaxID=479435 RepID=D2Q0X3_KRIFD|nr:ABC-F family ATP-binding cassette domain-containing protein [Kribbella flavida]ADB35674.1 putative transcriptional regulator, TetR family [Kribbella flavida DSM 17836]
MPKNVPLGEDRRAAIADAAIQLVATSGLRGLTHRAVDTAAGLPPGSTSYYLRTRDALLAACVNRMLESDLAAQPGAGSSSAPATPAELAKLLTATVLQLVEHRAEDQLARYELSLEASRRPELLDAITHGGRVLREHLAGMLAALGVPAADEAAWPFAAMLDGLIWDRVAGAGRTLPREAFEAGVHRAISALLRGFEVP